MLYLHAVRNMRDNAENLKGTIFEHFIPAGINLYVPYNSLNYVAIQHVDDVDVDRQILQ